MSSDRYEISIESHSLVPFLHRAVVVDTATPARSLVGHRVGFGYGRIAERISRDVEQMETADRTGS